MLNKTFHNLLIGLSFLIICSCEKQEKRPPVPEKTDRIVSMAPSITECIFAIGGGKRVVGVTTFCNYPETADALPKIGGYTDANYEMIYTLKPDLAIMLHEHYAAAERLTALDIPYIKVDTSTIPAIFETLRTLGEVIHTEPAAQKEIDRLHQRITEIQSITKDAPKRKVLVSIGRNMGSGGLTDVYVAGKNTLYNEMLELIGSENVYSGSMDYARLSHEGIMRLEPDVIIDLIPDLESSRNLNLEDVRREWDILKNVTAVKNGEVHVFGGDYVCVPGPRFVLTLENIAKAVHPECFKENK
jgi:iron complex transport system substrate-binding protein